MSPSLFLSIYSSGITVYLQLSDFIANDAVEALLKARVKPERRALYKDIDWKSAEDLVEGTKRRLVHGKLVVWLWSSFYLSILSLDQQGCLLRELRRAVLQKAEKRGLDLEVVTGAFDLSYLGFNLPVCVPFCSKLPYS